MEIKIYPEEKFERGKLRYILFGLLSIMVIILSFINDNIFGGIILVIITGVYIYFHTKPKHLITAKITPQELMIGQKKITWINLNGFVLEIEKSKLKIKNIVFLYKGTKHEIYTINDKIENIKRFSETLENYIPREGTYEQTFLEKFYRKIKL